MTELKPCPFCGKTPTSYTMKSAGYGEITCDECLTVFKFFLPETLAEVKEAWNRRADNEEDDAKNPAYIDADALRSALRNTVCADAMCDSFHKIFEAIESIPTVTVPQWISVNERMPEKKDSYLVVKDLFGDKIETICGFTKNLSDVSFVDFDGNKNPGWYDYDSEYGYFEVQNVTHWMPLPEPPRENDDAEEA